MKAYYLSTVNEYEDTTAIVFANTAREAKKLVWRTYIVDYWSGEWINLRVNRAKRYDGMEALPAAELAKHQWRDGWRWFDVEYPDPDEATDEEFYAWYDNAFGATA